MKSVIASDYRLTLSRRSDFHALARTKWPSVRVDRACLHIHSFTSTYTNSSTQQRMLTSKGEEKVPNVRLQVAFFCLESVVKRGKKR